MVDNLKLLTGVLMTSKSILYVHIAKFHFVFYFVDECSCPPIPANGHISGCNVTDIVGDTVEYSCRSGYHLVGASTRTCQTGGNWTGSVPTCVAGNINVKVF